MEIDLSQYFPQGTIGHEMIYRHHPHTKIQEGSTAIQPIPKTPTKSYEEIVASYDMEQAIREAGKQNRNPQWRDSRKEPFNTGYSRGGYNPGTNSHS